MQPQEAVLAAVAPKGKEISGRWVSHDQDVALMLHCHSQLDGVTRSRL
jgi:hypothetical protein